MKELFFCLDRNDYFLDINKSIAWTKKYLENLDP